MYKQIAKIHAIKASNGYTVALLDCETGITELSKRILLGKELLSLLQDTEGILDLIESHFNRDIKEEYDEEDVITGCVLKQNEYIFGVDIDI